MEFYHLFYVLTCLFWSCTAQNGGLPEYCQSEQFHARCPEGHVVQISTALYGRLELGRCATENFGFQCMNNVLHDLDSMCSGQQNCEVIVDQTSFPAARQCHNDLKSALHANYTCIPVTWVKPESCRYTRHIAAPLSAKGSGTLASSVTRDTQCGSADVPWLIEAQSGQRINISMVDFGLVSRSSSTRSNPIGGSSCSVYATLREVVPRRTSFTICGGQERTTHQYLSIGHSVEIRILKIKNSDSSNNVNFLLHYEVIGCPTLKVPRGGSVGIKEGVATFFCKHNSKLTWKQTCEGNAWVGPTKNCSLDSAAAVDNLMEKMKALPSGLSVVIIVGIALVIGLSILLVGLLCLRWKRKSLLSAYGATPNHQHYQTGQVNGQGGWPKNVHSIDHAGQIDMYAQHNDYSTMKYNSLIQHSQHHSQQMPLPPGADISGYSGRQDYTSRPYKEHIYESPDAGRRTNNGPNTSVSSGEDGPQYFDLDPQNASSRGNLPRIPVATNSQGGPHLHPVDISTMPRPHNVFDSTNYGHVAT